MRSSPKSEGLDYLERVNRAIDHVVQNLDQPLRLEDVARAACFSPFHFHRVFQSLVGETLARFVKRVRLERALHLIAHSPERSLTEIALECGFQSSSDFSRSFKRRFGVPPSAFDLATWRETRRGELDGLFVDDAGRPVLKRLPAGANPDGFEASLRELPRRTVAYVRVHDPYRGDGVVRAAERLMSWADEHGFGDRQWLGYMWEDPEIVPLERCRYDVAVEIDEDCAETGGDVGRLSFAAMRVAEVALDGGIELEQRAIDWLFGTWLPGSGLEPDAQPCFEAWEGRPFAHGFERFTLRVQLPVSGIGAA